MKRLGQHDNPLIPLVIGTQTAATNQFTGVLSLDQLKHGQSIRYWLPHAGKSTGNTLNLTLRNGSTTGEIQLYYKGSTKLTTQFSAGSLIMLTYLENANVGGVTYTGWWADGAVQSASGGSSSADHTHTWEDVANVQVLEDLVITSDDVNYGGYHKVSDEVPTLEQVQKGGTVTFTENGAETVTMNYPEGEMAILSATNGAVIAYNGLILAVVAYVDGFTYFGNTFEQGISFAQNDYVITHSFTISEYTSATEVVPIPYEFLPEPLQFGQTSYSVETLVDNQTIPMSGGEATEPLACEIVAGNTYDLTWNGVEYKGLVAKEVSVEGMSAVFIGNAGPMGLGEDTGEPFVVASVAGMGTIVMEYSGELTECTVTLKEQVTEIKPLDIKYLPESHQFGETTGYGDTLTWDLNTDGLVSVGDQFYHVSDVVPTLAELQQGGSGVGYSSEVGGNVSMSFTSDDILDTGAGIIILADMVPIVSTDGIELDGMVFPKAGIYFPKIKQDGVEIYVSQLTINGFRGFYGTIIKQLSSKYLEPFNYVEGSETVSIDLEYGFVASQIYKLTDDILTAMEFAQAVITAENGNGTQTITVNTDTISSEGPVTFGSFTYPLGFSNGTTTYILISSLTASSDLGAVELPSAGTYIYTFITGDETATKVSLTVAGKKMGGSLTLKPECLPNQEEEHIKQTFFPDEWGSGFIRVNETRTASDGAFGGSLYNAASKGGFKMSGWAWRYVGDTRTQIGKIVIDFTPAYIDENGAYIATDIVGCGGVLYGLYATITETETTFILNELALASSFLSSEGVAF